MTRGHAYYMDLAWRARDNANCRRRNAGAVIVRDHDILATGCDETPLGIDDCTDGGCTRCLGGDAFPEGAAYDACGCVHAEANALAYAARVGNALVGATIYSTLQPCFSCAKALIQAGVERAFYLESWKPQAIVAKDYELLQQRLGSSQLVIEVSSLADLDAPLVTSNATALSLSVARTNAGAV